MALGLSGVFRGTTTDFDQKHAFLENRRLAGAREEAQQNVATRAQLLRLRARKRVFASFCGMSRYDVTSHILFLVKGSIRPLKRFWPFCRRHMSEKRAHFHSLATSRFKKRLPLAAPAHGVHVTSPPRGFELLNWIVFEKPQPKLSKNSQIGTNSGLQPNGAWLNLTAKQLFSVRI